MSVQEGDTAPDFEMPATGGRTVSLAALKGKPIRPLPQVDVPMPGAVPPPDSATPTPVAAVAAADDDAFQALLRRVAHPDDSAQP